MDTFLGGVASISIFAAAYAVICKLLAELHLFKDKTLLPDFVKTGGLVLFVGLFYTAFLAFLHNTTSEQTNFFDLEKIFGIEQVPDYLFLTKILGKLLFDQTILVGCVLAFLYSNVFFWFLKRILSFYLSGECVQNLLWLVFCLPGCILLFIPNGLSFLLAICSVFLYLILKRLLPKNSEQKAPTFLQNPWIYYTLFVLLIFFDFLWMYRHFIMGGAA